MSTDHKDEEEIFKQAIKLKTSTERKAFLREACEDDAQLLSRLEILLKAHEQAADFLEVPPFDSGVVLDQNAVSETQGTIIGRYKLLEKIGEGGMAVVYMAEQEKPIRRKVALKIIKLGMDTKSVIARFEAERQALAMMDHPNIAGVLDAGSTDTGRPFFVMELVRGISITDYCDKNKLDPVRRLKLFIQVCNAVQHAHQKGIIHRDIKPSNVLVTLRDGVPVPKVIDFGIAKAINQRLTEKTIFTRFAQMIGTPEYMSPEQAEMSELDIDTRSDIYSLGVLLYELLTGTTPFDATVLHEAGYLEMQRIIVDKEPAKPSTKLSTLGGTLTQIAEHRRVEPGELCRIVRGDLDWIVMKSLEKDRTRRYETARELATDIERHLDNEPVLAGPPGAGYRLRKFVQRNKVAVTTILLIAVTLLMAVIFSVIYAREAATNAKEADNARQIAVEAKEEISGLLAGSYVDRAQALCEQGEVGRGMLWLADSLKIAPESSRDLERAIRTSLAAWHSQLHSLRAVVQYPDQINAVTFSPDGSRILAGCQDGTIRICDSTSGQSTGKPLQHGSGVVEVAISPSGKRIATRAEDGSIRLWDAGTLESVGESMQHKKRQVRGSLIAFTPDSSRLRTEGADGVARFWDANTGELLEQAFQTAFKRNVQAMRYCSEGCRAVRKIGRTKYQIFDADQGRPLGPPIDSERNLYAIAISSDGRRFAAGDNEGLIRAWESNTGNLAFDPIVFGGFTYTIAFSPDSSRIVNAGNTRMALLRNVATSELIGAPMRQRNTVITLAFSPDGTRLVTGNEDGVLRIWDLIQDKYTGEAVTHEDGILAAAYGPDGLRILTGTEDAVQVRNAVTGKPIGKPFSLPGVLEFIQFNPNGSHLLTTGKLKSYLQLWDLSSGKLVGEPFHSEAVRMAFSPDGTRILAGDFDGVAKLWDTATLKCLGELHTHRKPILGVAFSPDGSQFLTGSFDGTTQLWDATTLEPIGKPLVHQSEVKAAAFSPDGTKFLIGFADGTIRLWDTATLKPIGTPLQHLKVVCAVAFSPNCSQLLACCIDGTARLWDAATLKPIGPPLEHDCWWPTMSSFSSDGSEILLADRFGTAEIWRVPISPLDGEDELIVCWVQVVTGLELDPTGGFNVLDASEWQQRRRRLQDLGGPPDLALAVR